MSEEEIVKNPEGTSQRENPPKSLRKTAKKRRLEILEKVIKKVGFRNARERTKGLAETYQVAERTIRTDFEWIKKNVQPEDIKEIEITVRIAAMDQSLDKALERFVIEPTIENSKSIMQLAKQYREELEAWGEKEKVAEKVEHSGETSIIFKEVPLSEDDRNKGNQTERQTDRDTESSG